MTANPKAFTIIELLVVIAIIGILSVLVVPNFEVGASQFVLRRSASKLAQDLRRAQALSMSAVPFACPASWKMKGYGISLAAGNNYYLLKARCESASQPGTYNDQNAEDQILLEKGVMVLAPASQDVFFYPPNPTVDFGSPVGSVQITLALVNDSSQKKMVIINKAGLINVQ